ncbi:MAG: exodeoxyribonuclease VII small subunit [Chloroflexi bacterium HGW-Chloroflexi-10]|nr:MAG: exodeoxyribonuclease VII small subunit [Chloroflexi bacterium HGW-Chloroflexi-10]
MPKPTPVSEMTYEQALTALEAIVEQLENETQNLEESLALYERGQTLSQHCSALLQRAELRLRQVGQEASQTKEAED